MSDKIGKVVAWAIDHQREVVAGYLVYMVSLLALYVKLGKEGERND